MLYVKRYYMLERCPLEKQPKYNRNNVRLFLASKSETLTSLIGYIGFDVVTRASKIKEDDLVLFTSCGKDVLFTIVKKYEHKRNNVSLGYLVDCFSACYRNTRFPNATAYIEHYKAFENMVSLFFISFLCIHPISVHKYLIIHFHLLLYK